MRVSKPISIFFFCLFIVLLFRPNLTSADQPRTFETQISFNFASRHSSSEKPFSVDSPLSLAETANDGEAVFPKVRGQPVFYCFLDQKADFNCQQNFAPNALKGKTVSSNGTSAFIISPILNLKAEEYKFLVLKIKTKTDYPYLRLNILQKEAGIFPADDLIAALGSIRTSKNFKTYYFRLTDSASWRGIIEKIYLEIEPQNIQIESFKIAKGDLVFLLKSFWQELTILPQEAAYMVNFLPSPKLYTMPLIQYLSLILFCILSPLAIFQLFDMSLKKNWSTIFLVIILFFWLMMEIITSFNQYQMLAKDRQELSGQSYLLRKSIMLDRAVAGVNSIQFFHDLFLNFYPFLEFVKNNLPQGARVSFQSKMEGFNMIVKYHLADKFFIIDEIEDADFVLLVSQGIPDLKQLKLEDFQVYLKYPKQDDNIYKIILSRKIN